MRLLPMEPACRTCFAGVRKVLCHRTEASLEDPEMCRDRALWENVQQAFPHMLKFNSKGREDGSLSSTGLVHLCSRMMMDISEADLNDLFSQYDEDADGGLSLTELYKAAKTSSLFRSLVDVILAAADFRVGRDYDYTRSTVENYGFSSGGDSAAGLAETTVLERRAQWQDAVLRRLLPTGDTEEAPWLIIGLAMPEALPDQVLEWLIRRDILPVRHLVEVSHDLLVHLMPELPLYIKHHGSFASGAALARQEAQCMERRALEALMISQKNVWMPCHPRHAGHVISTLRGLPQRGHAIAVLDFRINAAVLPKRRRQAAKKTGRLMYRPEAPEIPKQEELEHLAAMADFIARIECSEDIPKLLSVEFTNASKCWPVLRSSFERKAQEIQELGKFPYALRPICLSRVKAGELLPGQVDAYGHLELDVHYFGPAMGCSTSARRLAQALPAFHAPLKLRLSGLGRAPELSQDSDPDMNLGRASRCAWLHGCASAGLPLLSLNFLHENDVMLSSPLIRVLTTGCLVHTNQKGEVAFIDLPAEKPTKFLQFGTPRRLSARADAELGQRWQPVSEEELYRGGAEYECWLCPGEVVDGRTVCGGFAYKLKAQEASPRTSIYFEVLQVLQ